MDKEYDQPTKEWRYEFLKALYLTYAAEYKITPLDFDKFEKMEGICQVKRALESISLQLKIKDPAAIIVSSKFVPADVFFHYSGYIREIMARRLRLCEIPESHREELIKGIEELVKNKRTRTEFREIKKLYNQIKNYT